MTEVKVASRRSSRTFLLIISLAFFFLQSAALFYNNSGTSNVLSEGHATYEFCASLNDETPPFTNFIRAMRSADNIVLGVNKSPKARKQGHLSVSAFAARSGLIYPFEVGEAFENLQLPTGEMTGAPIVIVVHLSIFLRFLTSGFPVLQEIRAPFILVTCCNDHSVPWELFSCTPGLNMNMLRNFLSSPILVRWYTQNYDVLPHSGRRVGFSECADEIAAGVRPDSQISSWEQGLANKVMPIPIGLRILSGEMSNSSCGAWDAIKSLQHVLNRSPDLKGRRRQILVPISKGTLSRDRRKEMYDALKNNSVVASIVSQRIPQAELYRMMSKYMFVATPASHGQDTYRFWETLHAGSIPVLLHGPLDKFYGQFPCIILSTWHSISHDDLGKWEADIVRKFGPTPLHSYSHKLSSDYWASRIRAGESTF